jgi:hypothetical protein
MPFTDQRTIPGITGTTLVEEVLQSIRDYDGTRILVEIEIELKMVGGLTPAASLIYGAVRAAFGSGFAMSEGPVVKFIRETTTYSQHSYGNALDIMVTGDLHHDIAYWLDANRGPLSIAHLLADPYFPSPLGDHYTHVHVDPYPQWGGTPPGHPV